MRKIGLFATDCPGNPIDFLSRCNVDLHVNRFDNPAGQCVAAEFVNGIITAKRLIRTENPRDLRAVQPRRFFQPPDMMVSVDDGLRHVCFRLLVLCRT